MCPIADRRGGFWTSSIERARELARSGTPAAHLLEFYAGLLERQKSLYDALRSSDTRLTGRLEDDVSILAPAAFALIRDVVPTAPEVLALEGRRLLESDAAHLRDGLLAYWKAPSDREFFPKAILQAYAQAVIDARVMPAGGEPSHGDGARCPFCGGAPQLSILDPERRHQCGVCLTIWPGQRVRCVNCGEADERKLGYFRADEFPHVRIDTCDACAVYVKTIDIASDGTAIPLVDEVAAASLDAWARERGYRKTQLNLLGF